MLIDNLYTTQSLLIEESAISATILLNKDHEIFKGHFPSMPVLPGVCMMQMVNDLAEKKINRKLTLKSAGTIKFLSVINPEEHPQIDLQLIISENDDAVQVDATLFAGTIVFFKINKAIY